MEKRGVRKKGERGGGKRGGREKEFNIAETKFKSQHFFYSHNSS